MAKERKERPEDQPTPGVKPEPHVTFSLLKGFTAKVPLETFPISFPILAKAWGWGGEDEYFLISYKICKSQCKTKINSPLLGSNSSMMGARLEAFGVQVHPGP